MIYEESGFIHFIHLALLNENPDKHTDCEHNSSTTHITIVGFVSLDYNFSNFIISISINPMTIQGVPELNVHILHVNSLRKIESKIIIPKICQRHIYRVISHLSRPIRKFNLRGGKYMCHRRVCAWMQLRRERFSLRLEFFQYVSARDWLNVC